MTACRNRRPLGAAALFLLVAHAAPAAAADDTRADNRTSGWHTAQVGEPLRLLPRPDRGNTAPETKSGPGVTTVPSEAEPDQPDRRGDISVESTTLGELDTDSVGLLDPANGGLGTAMWQGTDRRVVERLLPIVPGTLRSATLRTLATRLLLSRATAPAGERGEKSLLSIRVDRLVALGDLPGAIALLQAGATASESETLSIAEVETRFLSNDNAGACTRVRAAAGEMTGPYWQKALAYCLALSGENERAAMVSEILREGSDTADDELFYSLLDTLAGDEGPTVKSLPNPSGLQVSMLRAANVQLPADAIETERLALLRTAAFSPNVDLDARLKAAEQLVAYRAVEPGEIADLYNSMPFTKDQLADPAAFAAKEWGPRGRALMIRAASLTAEPAEKVKMLKRGWALAQKRGGRDSLLWAGVPELVALKPDMALLEDARDVGWALFATGRHAPAMKWFEFVLVNSQASPVAGRAMDALWPLAQLADPAGEMIWDESQLDRWWTGISKAKPKTARRTATMVYSLLEAIGKPVSGPAWSQLVGRPGSRASQAPDAALWKALDDASQNGRVGETVLYALIGLGAGGQDARSPIAVSAVVSALKRVGLEAEARGIALEAAIAAGA